MVARQRRALLLGNKMPIIKPTRVEQVGRKNFVTTFVGIVAVFVIVEDTETDGAAEQSGHRDRILSFVADAIPLRSWPSVLKALNVDVN